MPSPPRPDETKNDFVGRCVEFLMKEGQHPQKQCIAICYSMWQKSTEEKSESILDRIDAYVGEQVATMGAMSNPAGMRGTTTANIDVTPAAGMGDKKKKKKKKLLMRRMFPEPPGV